MRVESFDGQYERKILAGMIHDSPVLAKVSPSWKNGTEFASRPANVIGTWCVDYWNRYNAPPGREGVYSLAMAWAETQSDEATIRLVDSLLTSIIEEEERSGRPSPEHLIDKAGEYFTRVRVDKAIELAKGFRDSGRVDKALETLSSLSRVDMGKGTGTDLFIDKEEVYSTFDDREGELLIEYPGDLGKFFGNILSREAFVSFMAPEGTGKTWWLIDLAYRAMEQRKRVAFYEVGDLTKRQVKERFMVRVTGHPLRPCTAEWPESIKVGEVEHEVPSRVFTEKLSREKAWKACRRLIRQEVKSEESYFYLEVHHAGTITVPALRESLRSKERRSDGWTPEIIIIDYADLLAPITKKFDRRDQINETWEALRALSQDMHCLVITATQANRASYGAKIIKMEHSSEDKRKLAHVTDMIGINVSDEEKEVSDYFRLNLVKSRDNKFSTYRCVHVAGCLTLGNPAVVSVFPKGGWNAKAKERVKSGSGLGSRLGSRGGSRNGTHSEQ